MQLFEDVYKVLLVILVCFPDSCCQKCHPSEYVMLCTFSQEQVFGHNDVEDLCVVFTDFNIFWVRMFYLNLAQYLLFICVSISS